MRTVLATPGVNEKSYPKNLTRAAYCLLGSERSHNLDEFLVVGALNVVNPAYAHPSFFYKTDPNTGLYCGNAIDGITFRGAMGKRSVRLEKSTHYVKRASCT